MESFLIKWKCRHINVFFCCCFFLLSCELLFSVDVFICLFILCVFHTYVVLLQIYSIIKTHSSESEVQSCYFHTYSIFFLKPTYLCLCSFFHSLSSGSDLCAVLSHNKISKALIFILEEIQWCRVRVMITFWSFERHRDKGLFCAWWHSVCSLCRYRQIFTHCVNISDSVEAAVEALSWHYTNFQ